MEYLKKLITGNVLFSLDRIITPKLVHILYLLGLFAIVLWAISHLFSTFSDGFGSGLWGLVEIAVFSLIGFVVLRIICEAIIVYFKANQQAVEESNLVKVPVSLIDEVKEAIEELAQDEPLYKIEDEIVSKPKSKPAKRKTTAKRTPKKPNNHTG
ncbi:MAG: DUF4282 domain-containing protein [Devosiaceae bacterium]|nr:DUF4282 domain-containing protein [Devosiaceae bacterium]